MIDFNKVDHDFKVFISHEKNRKDLKEVINNKIFKKACEILSRYRRVEEQVLENTALSADAIVSVRRLSKRVGVEEFFDDLRQMTDPPVTQDQEVPATFEAPEPNQT